jgi:hypothetical protein
MALASGFGWFVRFSLGQSSLGQSCASRQLDQLSHATVHQLVRFAELLPNAE